MSRILAIHRYYWPDTPPYASMLRAITRAWTDKGHEVDVLTSQPSYKTETSASPRPPTECVDGVTVRRLAMRPDRSSAVRRVFNVAWFPWMVGLKLLFGRRYDVVMCSTAPPVVLGWVVSAAAKARGAQFVYHCMDLHPEIGRLSGEFANPAFYRLLARMELATCRRAAAIVVLSDDMLEAVAARDHDLRARTLVLTNFELPDYDDGSDAPSPLAADPSRLRIAFTGNVGRFQGLETIMRAVLGDDPLLDGIELVFMGDGAAKSSLEEVVALAPEHIRRRVVFLPHGAPSAARALLATSDLGLVSLTPEVIRYAYPSKMATYLGAGLPVLVAVEATSAMAQIVTRAGAGHVIPTATIAEARSSVLRILRHPEDLSVAASRATALWIESFSAERLLPRWVELVDDVTGRANDRTAS